MLSAFPRRPKDRRMIARDFRRLWWATGIDNLGTGAFTAAVPLLAVSVTRDPRLVSLVATAAYLPWLLLALPAGALAGPPDPAGVVWRGPPGRAGGGAAGRPAAGGGG